jgi:hypothetical protein
VISSAGIGLLNRKPRISLLAQEHFLFFGFHAFGNNRKPQRLPEPMIASAIALSQNSAADRGHRGIR